MKLKPIAIVACVVGAMTALNVSADSDNKSIRVQKYTQPLDTMLISGGQSLPLSVGVGSGAYHRPGDPKNVIYTVSDRGVNIKCEDDVAILGQDVCAAGKIFPVTNFTPSIYRFEYSHHHGWQNTARIQLKDVDGMAITGLPNPLTATDTETAFDKSGAPIAHDPEGVDTEALVRLADDSFWLADEYGPSLLHVAATGEVLERLVPQSVAADLAGANYSVLGKLPDILKKRKLNRGIESVAVSPDEQYLYFIMQSPLANPNSGAYKKSRNVRLFKLDRASMVVVGEWVYPLDLPETFASDNSTKQNGVKLSEMVATGQDQLLVLERISKTTKLYRIDLSSGSNILNSAWDNTATSPSLEQLTDLASVGIMPVQKELFLNSDTDYPGLFPAKVEGIALTGEHSMVLVNDNDFGIAGDSSHFVMLNRRHHH